MYTPPHTHTTHTHPLAYVVGQGMSEEMEPAFWISGDLWASLFLVKTEGKGCSVSGEGELSKEYFLEILWVLCLFNYHFKSTHSRDGKETPWKKEAGP